MRNIAVGIRKITFENFFEHFIIRFFEILSFLCTFRSFFGWLLLFYSLQFECVHVQIVDINFNRYEFNMARVLLELESSIHRQ